MAIYKVWDATEMPGRTPSCKERSRASVFLFPRLAEVLTMQCIQHVDLISFFLLWSAHNRMGLLKKPNLLVPQIGKRLLGAGCLLFLTTELPEGKKASCPTELY